jgi:hypothetical protein
VDVFLEETKEKSKFADLWQPFAPTSETVKPDIVQRQLEKALREAQTTLVSANWHGQVLATHPNAFLLQILPENEFALAPEVEALYWPLSLSSASAFAYDVKNTPSATFGPLAVESLTAFIVFQLTAHIAGQTMLSQFVLRVPLEGVPVDRQERLLRAMLKNREQVMRFLLFILLMGKTTLMECGMALLDALRRAGCFSIRYQSVTPLFESLVQALHRDLPRLDHRPHGCRFGTNPEGAQLLPQSSMILAPIGKAKGCDHESSILA